ncbi:MAG: YdcF family protein [Propionibacteriales bacterium]|nr:YdcF family protein [Propionibacteriales bacterium]
MQRAGTSWTPWRVLLLVLGALVGANAAWLAATANFTIGTAMAAGLGVGLLGWGVWYRRVPRALAATFLVVLAAFSCLSGFLAAFGNQPTATYDESAVIVLGAAVHGSEPSKTLTGRLDAAVAYHARNPAALIVVSGGQGWQEDLPEGVAMQRYLLAQGVPDSVIVVEDRATSTEENFAFSQALLDQRLAPGYRVVVISDEFHLYRASRLAAAAGLNATWIGRATPWYFWTANYLREDLMVAKLWITGS